MTLIFALVAAAGLGPLWNNGPAAAPSQPPTPGCPEPLLGDNEGRTWKSLLHSIIMWAKPCVAAKFSLSSLWSGFPKLHFL